MIAAASAVTTLIHLPVLLVGGLAILIQADLPGFDEARVGMAFSAFFGCSALASMLGGQLSDRWGPRRGMLLAIGVGTAALLALSGVNTYVLIIAICAITGIGNGIGQPAANLGIARGVSPSRHGLAFGVKQSAVPTAGLLAGLAIPLLGLTVGWRPTFIVAAVTVLIVAPLVPRSYAAAPKASGSAGRGRMPLGSTLLLMIGTASTASAANSVPAFLVFSAVASGFTPAQAGFLLAAGSVAGSLSRLTVGWLADRRGRSHLLFVSAMMATGALSYLVLALSQQSQAIFVIGTIVAFAAGWGWPGLIVFAVVRLNPAAPAAASGRIQAAAATGSVLGPPLLGIVVRTAPYAVVWSIAAGLAALGAILIFSARFTMLRSERRSAEAERA